MLKPSLRVTFLQIGCFFFLDLEKTNILTKLQKSYCPQLICSKSTIEALERCEICTRVTKETPERRH